MAGLQQVGLQYGTYPLPQSPKNLISPPPRSSSVGNLSQTNSAPGELNAAAAESSAIISPRPTVTPSPPSSLSLSGLQNLIESLQVSIAYGEAEQASHLASLLAKHKTKVSMLLEKEAMEKSNLRLKVYVEYKEKSAGYVTLKVNQNYRIADLKTKMLLDFGLPTNLQCWICGKNMPHDSETLETLNVTSDSPVFLYVMSAKFAGMNREETQRECRKSSDYEAVPHPNGAEMGVGVVTFQQPAERSASVSSQPPAPQAAAINRPPATPAAHAPVQERVQLTWTCPRCTYANLPTWPGCEMCDKERPKDFVIPPNYVMTDREKKRIAHEQISENEFVEAQRRQEAEEMLQTQRNYEELLRTDDQHAVANLTMFNCQICFDVIPAGEGVVLRECLHCFCRECLQQHITMTEDAQVCCPNLDCDGMLQDREIMGIVPQETFYKYLQRGLAMAEHQGKNTFHCKTADCPGWVFYDDDVNFFSCGVCQSLNCLTCKAIHEGMNCKEYQADIALKAQSDLNARRTADMLQAMLTSSEAMKCPGCSVILQKKDGCDYMMCSMCHTEICWATRGPRWGPGGNGDTSGGCRCRVNGQKCHPQCRNCH